MNLFLCMLTTALYFIGSNTFWQYTQFTFKNFLKFNELQITSIIFVSALGLFVPVYIFNSLRKKLGVDRLFVITAMIFIQIFIAQDFIHGFTISMFNMFLYGTCNNILTLSLVHIFIPFIKQDLGLFYNFSANIGSFFGTMVFGLNKQLISVCIILALTGSAIIYMLIGGWNRSSKIANLGSGETGLLKIYLNYSDYFWAIFSLYLSDLLVYQYLVLSLSNARFLKPSLSKGLQFLALGRLILHFPLHYIFKKINGKKKIAIYSLCIIFFSSGCIYYLIIGTKWIYFYLFCLGGFLANRTFLNVYLSEIIKPEHSHISIMLTNTQIYCIVMITGTMIGAMLIPIFNTYGIFALTIVTQIILFFHIML